MLIPAGSEMRGVVSSVHPAGRVDRKGSMTVTFDQLTINGSSYPMRGTVTQALESEGVRGEAARIGAGAGVGAIIGGILGGFKGALAGILIGGGGVVAATEGKDVELPAGTILACAWIHRQICVEGLGGGYRHPSVRLVGGRTLLAARRQVRRLVRSSLASSVPSRRAR